MTITTSDATGAGERLVDIYTERRCDGSPRGSDILAELDPNDELRSAFDRMRPTSSGPPGATGYPV